MRSWIVSIVVLSLSSPLSFADSLCPNAKDKQAAEAMLAKAEASEKAGNAKEAYASAQKASQDCLSTAGLNRLEAVKRNAGRSLGEQAEKSGKLKEAYETFERSGNPADADRVMLKQVKAASNDLQTMDTALGHFQRRNNQTQLKELRAQAAKTSQKYLAAEEKAFATSRESLDELNKARAWSEHAGSGEKQVQQRAEQRGDALLGEDSRRSLERAINYFHFTGNDKKIQKVKDKAKQLADAHARKGENETAVHFYRIAGLDDQAEQVAEKTKADKEKAEVKRKQDFKKDQKALEKELGL